MKFFFVSLLFILTIGLTTALADDVIISDKVKESFNKEFVGAKSVEWRHIGDYQVALFVFCSQRLEAYFNADGELAGSARNILFEQMPLTIMRLAQKRYAGADILDILEISNPEGISYLLTVEKQNKRFRVKVGTGGDFLRVDKIKE